MVLGAGYGGICDKRLVSKWAAAATTKKLRRRKMSYIFHCTRSKGRKALGQSILKKYLVVVYSPTTFILRRLVSTVDDKCTFGARVGRYISNIYALISELGMNIHTLRLIWYLVGEVMRSCV